MAPIRGTVLEYRHDLFSQAEITDVSIPGFDEAPWFGTPDTWLMASAWRPGCDGGLLVGGEFVGSGLAIEFALEGGVLCEAATPVPSLTRPAWLALAAVVGGLGLGCIGRSRRNPSA